jgi:RimJ/RimL family protein N-acetyltransferase
MQLIPIEELPPTRVIPFLWGMLASRNPHVNISHHEMPSMDQHAKFVKSHPYQGWFLILQNGKWVGNIYLTQANEIGIHMLPEARGLGIGRTAVQELMAKYGARRYLANISPSNPGSIDFFKSLGFKMIQYTFEKET